MFQQQIASPATEHSPAPRQETMPSGPVVTLVDWTLDDTVVDGPTEEVCPIEAELDGPFPELLPELAADVVAFPPAPPSPPGEPSNKPSTSTLQPETSTAEKKPSNCVRKSAILPWAGPIR
jgi:hypothetical protein